MAAPSGPIPIPVQAPALLTLTVGTAETAPVTWSLTRSGLAWIAAAILVVGLGAGAWHGYSSWTAAPSLTVDDARGSVGKQIRIAATGNASDVRWISTSPDLELAPHADLKDAKTMHVVSAKAGVYTVLAVPVHHGALGEAIPVTVTVGQPGPGPGPAPGPTDPFAAAVAAAYAAEADPQKAAYVQKLAALYSQAAAMMDADTSKTMGELFTKLKAASGTLLPATALPKVRAVVGADENAVLGTDPAKAVDKAACKAEFTKCAAALGACK
jgi:hypothetical protein